MIKDIQILKEIKQVVLEVDSEAEVIYLVQGHGEIFMKKVIGDVLVSVDKEETDFNFKRKI